MDGIGISFEIWQIIRNVVIFQVNWWIWIIYIIAARLKINSEFRKYQRISSQEAIAEVSWSFSFRADIPSDTLFFWQLIKLGNQAEEILRTSVVQVTPTEENTFSNLYLEIVIFILYLIAFYYSLCVAGLHITKDTFMHNNTPYRGWFRMYVSVYDCEK